MSDDKIHNQTACLAVVEQRSRSFVNAKWFQREKANKAVKIVFNTNESISNLQNILYRAYGRSSLEREAHRHTASKQETGKSFTRINLQRSLRYFK